MKGTFMHKLGRLARWLAVSFWAMLAGYWVGKGWNFEAGLAFFISFLLLYALIIKPDVAVLLFEQAKKTEQAQAHADRLRHRNYRLHARVVTQMRLIEEQRKRLAAQVPDDVASHHLTSFGHFGAQLYELWTAAENVEQKAFVKSHPLWAYAQAKALIEQKEETDDTTANHVG